MGLGLGCRRDRVEEGGGVFYVAVSTMLILLTMSYSPTGFYTGPRLSVPRAFKLSTASSAAVTSVR